MPLKADVPATPTRRAVLKAFGAIAGAGLLTATAPTTGSNRAKAAGRAAGLSLDTRTLTLDGRPLVLEIASD